MQKKFENWLIQTGKTDSTAYNYAQAINRISQHFQQNEGKILNLYKIILPKDLEPYVKMYNKEGKYEAFGDKGNGTNRAAINQYNEFISKEENFKFSSKEQKEEKKGFSEEKELQSAMVSQIDTLFPDYVLEGEKYPIAGKEIDILLKKGNELLVIELKRGNANYAVFGQITMYIQLLKEKYPNNEIKGCIIANSIDDSLAIACRANEDISLKTYLTKIDLLNY